MKAIFKVQKTKGELTFTEWSVEKEIDWRGNGGREAHWIFKQYEEEVGLKDGWLYTVVMEAPEIVLLCQR